MTGQQRQVQFLQAYLRHRLADRADHHERVRAKHSAVGTWVVVLSTTTFAAAAVLGVVGVADGARRPMWGFLATILAALAVAITAYEAAFGFRRSSRRSAETAAALRLLETRHPVLEDLEDGDESLGAFVADVESALHNDVGAWTRRPDRPLPAEPEPSDQQVQQTVSR